MPWAPLPALRADADTPPTPLESRLPPTSPGSEIREKAWFSRKSLVFSKNHGFPENQRIFAPWAGTGARPACRLEGSRGSVGIGPQGRESVLRHSTRAGGIIVIDSYGPESPQVILKRNSEISQKRTFLKKMTICASGPQNPTHVTKKSINITHLRKTQ